MSGPRFVFSLETASRNDPLPQQLVIRSEDDGTTDPVLLKLFAYLIFHGPRIQIDSDKHLEDLPLTPNVVRFDDGMVADVCVECGTRETRRLEKLSAKMPAAELWLFFPSPEAAHGALEDMPKRRVRRDRFHVFAFEAATFDELRSLLLPRNSVYWMRCDWDYRQLEFELNEVWFECPFLLWRGGAGPPS